MSSMTHPALHFNFSNIDNFTDTYKLLSELKITHKVNGTNSLTSITDKLMIKPNNHRNYLKVEKMGKKILHKTKDEINSLLNNEIKKT